MKKALLILLVGLLWCNVGFAEIIEFKKCWYKETARIFDSSKIHYKSWDDWNKKSYFEMEWGGVKGSDIPYEDVVYTIDTTNGIVTRVEIHTDEFLEGWNIAAQKILDEDFKKWKEGGKKGKIPRAEYLSKFDKKTYRLLGYSAGHISFDYPEIAKTTGGAMLEATLTFELNISEGTIHRSYKSMAFVVNSIIKCDESYDSGSGTETASSSGTAFFINKKGNLLTNNHVVEGCKSQKINYFNKEYDTKIIATDKTLDLALLKADVRPRSFISFSKDEPRKRQTITTAGYPLGKYLSDDLKINDGRISALKGFENNSNEITHDISINPGNSGGPIVNEKGQLVAVAVSGMAKDVTEGLNFGIKASAAANFLKSNKISPSTGYMSFSTSDDKLVKLLEESTVYTFCN